MIQDSEIQKQKYGHENSSLVVNPVDFLSPQLDALMVQKSEFYKN